MGKRKPKPTMDELVAALAEWEMPATCDLAYWQSQRATMSDAAILKATAYPGLPRWSRIREIIWHRDNGTCWACGDQIDQRYYDLGHIIDRVAGGLDIPSNLVVMCNYCNRTLKPVHETTKTALRWRDWNLRQMQRGREELAVLLEELHREDAA